MQDGIVDSYDPREWARRWELRQSRAQVGGRQVGNSPAVALGLAAAILATGALAAWMVREAPSAAPVRATTAAILAKQTGLANQTGPGEVRRTLVISRAADLPQLLTAQGLDPQLSQQLAASALLALDPAGEVRAVLVLDPSSPKPRFVRLEASNSDSSGVIVRQDLAGQITTARVVAQVEAKIFVQHGVMDGDSFYSSAVAIGIPNSLIPVFAKALAFDFDFQREVAAGDAFETAYMQKVNASGEAIGAPTLLYASLTTASKSASVYRFVPPGAQEEWFDASGRSAVRSLMRTPIDGARITSKFGMRFHPTLHYTRLHAGVDFAAPIGTPIYAAADGTVTSATPTGCGGNMVVILHDKGLQTRYFHASRYAEGLHAGQHVSQGQTVSYVGVTGTCTTGPHLHYETIVNAEHVDPLSIPADNSGKVLSGPELLAFEALRDRVDVGRAQQQH